MNAALAYCDYNATAPLHPAARAAMIAALDQGGNASSPHAIGRRARGLVESAREALARAIRADAAEVIFVGGGTEANALALSAAAAAQASVVFVSAIEHDSVRAEAQRRFGDRVQVIPVTGAGLVDVDWLTARLADLPAGAKPFVSVMLANNETGVVQDIAAIAATTKAAGGLIHTDAAQGFGRMAIDVKALGVDLLSLCAHKAGGPVGIGALWARPGIGLEPIFHGGGQERSRRAGTENIAAIAGMGALAGLAHDLIAQHRALQTYRDALEASLSRRLPDWAGFGNAAPRLPQTACFGIAGLRAETLLMALDLEGVCVSSGSACSSGKVRASHVLAAMGAAPALAQSALRVSFGWASAEADFHRLEEALIGACARLQTRTLP